jgi:hypothetical protein
MLENHGQLPLLAEQCRLVSMALPTIPEFSGNDMARIAKRMKLVRAILKCETNDQLARLLLSVLLRFAPTERQQLAVLAVGSDLTATRWVRLWHVATGTRRTLWDHCDGRQDRGRRSA